MLDLASECFSDDGSMAGVGYRSTIGVGVEILVMTAGASIIMRRNRRCRLGRGGWNWYSLSLHQRLPMSWLDRCVCYARTSGGLSLL